MNQTIKLTIVTLVFLCSNFSIFASSEPTADSSTKKKTIIRLIRGDITKQDFADPAHTAIVNAANQQLIGGSGVCGSIYAAAAWPNNPCEVCPLLAGIRCPAGEARLTDGGALSPLRVIHAVGPDCRIPAQREKKAELLASTYRESLEIALKSGITTIAFPCISTNIFAYTPIDEATDIAIKAVVQFIKEHPEFYEIRFVIFSPDTANYDLYLRKLSALDNSDFVFEVKSQVIA